MKIVISKKIIIIILASILLSWLSGCSSGNTETTTYPTTAVSSSQQSSTEKIDQPDITQPDSDDIEPPIPEETPSGEPSTVTLTDIDRDGISDEIEDQLISQFAPIVKFHTGEQYLLANIPWYLDRVRMRYDVSFGFDAQLLDHGNINVINLVSQEYKGQSSGLSAEGTNFFLEQTDTSGGDELDNYRLLTRKGSEQAEWVCYAHVRPASISDNLEMYDIQYIFFYAYNGDLLVSVAESAHEADFEHITVRVKDDLSTIDKIFYAAHDIEGRWYDYQSSPEADNGYELSDDGRPIVYAALNSHASYPWADIWDRGNLPDDVTNENGIEWNTLGRVINTGEKQYPFQGNGWIQYSGRWGEIGETGFTTGPFGPAYQGWWNAD
jgi:hypothetical protein